MSFFSKYRILIMLAGIDVGLLFILIATRLISNSVPQDLLINLSAGAMTISLTVVVVDFLISRERKFGNKEVVGLAAAELHHAGIILLLPLGKLYGINLPVSASRIDKACSFFVSELSKVDMKSQELEEKDDLTEDFIFALESALNSLEEVIQNYAYALPNDMRGIVIKLYKECLDIRGLIHGFKSDGNELDPTIVRSFYLGLWEDIRKLMNFTKALKG